MTQDTLINRMLGIPDARTADAEQATRIPDSLKLSNHRGDWYFTPIPGMSVVF